MEYKQKKVESKIGKYTSVSAVVVVVIYEVNLLPFCREIRVEKYIVLGVSSHIYSHLEATSANTPRSGIYSFLNIERDRASARLHSFTPNDDDATTNITTDVAVAVDVFAYVIVKCWWCVVC